MVGPGSDKNRWRRTLQTNLIWRGYLASNYVLPQRRTLYCLTPTICTAEQSYHFTSNVIANLVRSIKYHLCSHIYKRLQFEKEKEGEEEWAGGGGRGPVEKFNWNAFLVSKFAVYGWCKEQRFALIEQVLFTPISRCWVLLSIWQSLPGKSCTWKSLH